MNQAITTAEILYLNDAAKALKQKNFRIIDDCLVGIDNEAIVSYTRLNPEMISIPFCLNGFIINAKELSAFAKDIAVESSFEIQNDSTGQYINTVKCRLNFSLPAFNYKSVILNNLSNIKNMQRNITPLEQECDITSELIDLFSLKKDSGCIYYPYKNKYFMTLFYGILPLNKSDKIFVTIYNNNSESFISIFKVRKKKFEVYVCVLYLYL